MLSIVLSVEDTRVSQKEPPPLKKYLHILHYSGKEQAEKQIPSVKYILRELTMCQGEKSS